MTKEAQGRESADYQKLHDRGYFDGFASGSWVIDGNTKEESARELLRMLDEGDPQIYDSLPSPSLSGEWADEPTWADVLEDEGFSREDEDDTLFDYYCSS